MTNFTEPTCCDEPMVHNSGTGQYECAAAYFALLDGSVIRDYDPPALLDPEDVSPEHRALFHHWLGSMRPDGWDMHAMVTGSLATDQSRSGTAPNPSGGES